MYYVVTGQRPIEAPARAHDDPMPRAFDVGDRGLYSEALLRAIDWALDPDEKKRPTSADAYVHTLSAITGAWSAATQRAEPPRETPSGSIIVDDEAMASLESALRSMSDRWLPF